MNSLPPGNSDLRLLLGRLGDALGDETELWAAYLFGSRARGEAGPDSDVDVAVLSARPVGLERLVTLEGKLERAVATRVQVVDLRRVVPWMALDVLRGVRFLVRDPASVDEYELYLLRRAGDLAPLERERRAVLLGRKSS